MNRAKEEIYMQVITAYLYPNPNPYSFSVTCESATNDSDDDDIFNEILRKYTGAWEKLAEM